MSENDQTVFLNEYTIHIDDPTVTYADILERIHATFKAKYKYDNGIILEP
jgi:hypothetical protein